MRLVVAFSKTLQARLHFVNPSKETNSQLRLSLSSPFLRCGSMVLLFEFHLNDFGCVVT